MIPTSYMAVYVYVGVRCVVYQPLHIMLHRPIYDSYLVYDRTQPYAPYMHLTHPPHTHTTHDRYTIYTKFKLSEPKADRVKPLVQRNGSSAAGAIDRSWGNESWCSSSEKANKRE